MMIELIGRVIQGRFWIAFIYLAGIAEGSDRHNRYVALRNRLYRLGINHVSIKWLGLCSRWWIARWGTDVVLFDEWRGEIILGDLYKYFFNRKLINRFRLGPELKELSTLSIFDWNRRLWLADFNTPFLFDFIEFFFFFFPANCNLAFLRLIFSTTFYITRYIK